MVPKIKNGAAKLEISYEEEAKTNFQKKVRRGSEVLRDHVTKNMAPLIEARFELIPTDPGSDWHDLPNKVILDLILIIIFGLLHSFKRNVFIVN